MSLSDQEETIQELHQQDTYEQEARDFDENEFEHEVAFVEYRRLILLCSFITTGCQ